MQDLITTAPALPADPAHSSIGEPSKTTVPVSDGTSADGKTSFTVTLNDEDGQPISFVAQGSGDVKVLVDGDPLASAKLTVKDGSADTTGNNNGSNNGGKDNSGNNNGASDNAGKNNGKNNGNKGGAAAQNAQKSAQVLASTGAAVTAIVAVALAFVSFGMLALAARRRKDEE